MLPPGMLSLKTQPRAVEGTGHIQATGHTQVAPAYRLAEPSLLAVPGQTPDMRVSEEACSHSSHPPCLVFQKSSRGPRSHGAGTTQPRGPVQTPDTKPTGLIKWLFPVSSRGEAYFAATIIETLCTAGLRVARLLGIQPRNLRDDEYILAN